MTTKYKQREGISKRKNNEREHPIMLPTFLCLPCFVRGTPIDREILFFAEDIPNALLGEKEKPYFLPIIINLELIYELYKKIK